jgi:hypothetical protein
MKDAQEYLASPHITQYWTRPNSPKEKPFAERLIGTLQRECLERTICQQDSLTWHGICFLSYSQPKSRGKFTGKLCPQGSPFLFLRGNSAQNTGLAAWKGTVRCPKAAISGANTPPRDAGVGVREPGIVLRDANTSVPVPKAADFGSLIPVPVQRRLPMGRNSPCFARNSAFSGHITRRRRNASL